MAKKFNTEKYLHLLYEASVQGVGADLDFAARVFKKHNGSRPVKLREDFCGTAALACEWIRRNKANHAWGVDIDQPTLDWATEHNLPELGDRAKNLKLVCGDVMTADTPKSEIVMALNFSFCIFKTREMLCNYFKAARRNLKKGGILVTDIYGGTEAVEAKTEEKSVAGPTAPDGFAIPDFTYIWDQAEYDVISHRALNYIHFEVPGYRRISKAFTYDWRLWTIPEMRELMMEAGFSDTEVYIHGWTGKGESDEIFRRRETYENAQGWIAYVVGVR